ncbi:phytanoyl-CoA dioxygenase family protein [bacterium]|nr:MAG: phytanoyl-CoA dioxygenase family protein [bacterium]
MLNPNQLEAFARDGFVKGSTIIDEAQCDVLCDEVLRVIADAQNGVEAARQPVGVSNLSRNADAPVWQVVNIWEGSEAFEELVRNPILAEEIGQLMKMEMDAHEIRLFHDQIQYKPAQKGGVNMWHQDSPYWPVLEPKDVQLTAWVALDDAGEDNGCMSMVPGSQRWGNQIEFLHTLKNFTDMPGDFEGHDVTVVPCPVERGRVHFHHPLTWHGSPANNSGRPRRAVALHFMTERAVFDASKSKLHPMGQFVEGGDGEKVYGEHFPLVWEEKVAVA